MLLKALFTLALFMGLAVPGIAKSSFGQDRTKIIKACRYLGPWARSKDSDFCSCVTGHSVQKAKAQKEFKLDQVRSYFQSLAQLKIQKAKNPKARGSYRPIQDPFTKAEYEHISTICHNSPHFKNSNAFTKNLGPVRPNASFFLPAQRR